MLKIDTESDRLPLTKQNTKVKITPILPKNKDEYAFCLKSNLPKEGWIQGCFLCSLATAQTVGVDRCIWEKINEKYKSTYELENCKIYMCYYCQNDIKNCKVSQAAVNKYCETCL